MKPEEFNEAAREAFIDRSGGRNRLLSADVQGMVDAEVARQEQVRARWEARVDEGESHVDAAVVTFPTHEELQALRDENADLSEQLANLRERFDEMHGHWSDTRRNESHALRNLEFEQRTVQFLVRQPGRRLLKEQVEAGRRNEREAQNAHERAEERMRKMQERHAEKHAEHKAETDDLRAKIERLEHDLAARVDLGLAKEETISGLDRIIREQGDFIAELRGRVERAERADSIAERANETLRTRIDTVEAAHRRYVDVVKKSAKSTHQRALAAARKVDPNA